MRGPHTYILLPSKGARAHRTLVITSLRAFQDVTIFSRTNVYLIIMPKRKKGCDHIYLQEQPCAKTRCHSASAPKLLNHTTNHPRTDPSIYKLGKSIFILLVHFAFLPSRRPSRSLRLSGKLRADMLSGGVGENAPSLWPAKPLSYMSGIWR